MPNFYCFFLWTRVLFNITNLYQIYRLGCLTSLNSMLVVIQLFKWLKHYMVPVGIASYVLAAYPLCFRGCGQKRVAFHIWWQCLKVRRFSIWVYNFIYSLTQVHLIKSRNMNYYAVRWKVHRDIRKDWLHFFFCGSQIKHSQILEICHHTFWSVQGYSVLAHGKWASFCHFEWQSEIGLRNLGTDGSNIWPAIFELLMFGWCPGGLARGNSFSISFFLPYFFLLLSIWRAYLEWPVPVKPSGTSTVFTRNVRPFSH